MLYKEITKSKLLFYLLILLLPTQLGYHFWPDFTSVLGLRIDYLSPTIYLTDLIVLVIVVANFSSRFSFFFFFLTLLTIFLSFSRAVWGIGLLVITSWWMFKKKQRFIRRLLLFFFIVSLFYCFIVLLDFGSLSFQRRMVLNRAAWEMVRSSPLFGVGLNNFIPRLPEFWRSVEAIRFLQPVHNIYLLVGAELGVFGGIGVIGGIGKTILKVYKEKRWPVFWALMAIFLLGLFDHYWLTLQQNQLLLAIILGLAWKQEKT